MNELDKQNQQTEIEAAVFRRLVQHLQNHTEVQNIDLMILADFCRNCLAKWYESEAKQRGVSLEDGEAREKIYGMPYQKWKSQYQTPATPEQLQKLQQRQNQK